MTEMKIERHKTKGMDTALLAQIYLGIWSKNPKISRADAVKEMQKQGIDIRSVSDISRITGSDEFRKIQEEFISLSRTQIIQSLAGKIPQVINHQYAIATGEVGYAKDAVGAARVLTDLWRAIGESVDGIMIQGDSGVRALQINNYYGAIDEKDAPKIIKSRVEFDPDEIKASYVDQSTIVEVTDVDAVDDVTLEAEA